MARVSLVSSEIAARMSGTASPQARGALMHRPAMADAIGLLNEACFASELPPRLNELVRYRIAQTNRCTRCMAYRSPTNAQAGVSDELLERVLDWRTDPSFSALERDALDYAERYVFDPPSIDDDLVDRLRGELGDAGVVDLTICIGKYVMLGRIMVALDLDQDVSAGLAPLLSARASPPS